MLLKYVLAEDKDSFIVQSQYHDCCIMELTYTPRIYQSHIVVDNRD